MRLTDIPRPSPIKIIISLLLLLFLVMQASIWVGEEGMKEVWRLTQEIKLQRQDNQARAERNAALEAEVKDLKEGLEAIEEHARMELGMIKQGETFFQVVEEPTRAE